MSKPKLEVASEPTPEPSVRASFGNAGAASGFTIVTRNT